MSDAEHADQPRIERLATELASTMAHLPEATMVLFTAPAPDIEAMDARESTAIAIAERAEAVVVCPLAEIEPALLSQAGAVALDVGLELAVVGDGRPA